jgi:DNA repair protein RadD
LLSQEDIADFFTRTPVRIAGNPSLREPQIEGHQAVVEYFSRGGRHAVEQIPVGCGKTGLIALLPFGIARGRVLVLAPNLTIRDQIAEAVDSSDPGNFYRASGAITDLTHGPYRSVLDSQANLHDADAAHVVVTNIHQLAETSTSSWSMKDTTTLHRAGRPSSSASPPPVLSA